MWHLFLWVVLIDDIIRTNLVFPFKIVAYADDISLIAFDKSPETAEQNLQKMCDVVISKLKNILLNINAQRTVLIIFYKKRALLSPNIHLTINSTVIFPSTHTKLLGVILDKNFLWAKHIDEKCTKARKQIFNVRRLLR